MEARQKERVYEEFDPTIEWERDSAVDTLKLYLPGFRKEQMKVQVTTTRCLRITGERELGDNKCLRFRKEIPISSNYDTNQISAKFERGILFIKHPKIITPDRKPPQPPVEPLGKAAQPPKDAPRPPKPPQPKAQTPPPPNVESPMPELPKIGSEAAKARTQSKNEIPDKVEEKKDEDDEAGIANAAANMRQESMTGESGNVAAGVQKLNYRQILSDVVKNPRNLMQLVMAVILTVFFWLRAVIMKPIRYFKKSEN